MEFVFLFEYNDAETEEQKENRWKLEFEQFEKNIPEGWKFAHGRVLNMNRTEVIKDDLFVNIHQIYFYRTYYP
jgi:hypothetical protein